ncbi:histidine kinase [Oscillospiraceae bacterium PP1C4]
MKTIIHKKNWKVVPLKKKALIFFSAAIILIGVFSFVLYYNMAKTLWQFNDVYSNLSILEGYSDTIEKMSGDLNKYISESDRPYISSFYHEYETLLEEMHNTKLLFIKRDDNMLFKNISHMFESYGEEAEAAINEHRKRNINESSSRISRTLKIQTYIQDGIEELILSYISQSEIFQKDLLNQLIILRSLILLLIIMAVALYVLLAVYFNRALIKPIDALIKMANKISHGDFDVEKIKVGSHSELELLSDTLYSMSYEIKDYIKEIKEKAEVEKLLKIKEMENLRISALLQETELKRLQAQVNPHFLFNTLTTLHNTAFLEGAYETCEISEAISKMLRYNLRKSNTIVRLRDEIENIRYYLYIQEKRYKHRVQVDFMIDESLLELPIPNMTVQPIVENSFIHGIEKNEKNGVITLKLYKEQPYAVIEITDNGMGIEEDKITQLRDMVCDESGYSGHTSNIGINNVVKRLQAFYNGISKFEIESVPNEGTTIQLFLPFPFVYDDEFDIALLEENA